MRSVCAHVCGNKFPRSAEDGRHTPSSCLAVCGRLPLDLSWLSDDLWASHQKRGQEVKLRKPAGQQPFYSSLATLRFGMEETVSGIYHFQKRCFFILDSSSEHHLESSYFGFHLGFTIMPNETAGVGVESLTHQSVSDLPAFTPGL